MKFDSNTITIKHENNIPFGWTIGKIEDLIGKFGLFCDGDWVESKDQDPTGNVRLIQLADIGDGYYRNKSFRFLTEEKADELNCTFLKPGDLLIARLGEPLGKSCIFPGDEKISVTAVDVCIVRTGKSDILHKWLMYSINSTLFRKAIGSLQSGTTRKRISRKNLAKITFPISPHREQHRIVAKIEELFTKLDAGVEALKQVQAQLKRYRQSVLKAAMEGRLTAEWREQHKDELEPADKLLKNIREEQQKEKAQVGSQMDIESPLHNDTSDFPKLPNGWELTSIQNICEKIVDCPHSTPKWTSFGYICLRTTNFLTNRINLEDVRYVSLATFNDRIKRLRPRTGDVVYSREGGILGVACILPENVEVCLGQRMMLFRAFVSPKYLMYWLNSPFTTHRVKKLIGGSASPHLNVGDVKKFPIPFASEEEQHHITKMVDYHFSIADTVEGIIIQSLSQASQIRQSILKRAFKGKLVTQDSNDLPASALLERIKAEKTKSKKSKQMEMF